MPRVSSRMLGRGHSRGTGPRATAPGGYLCFGLLRWAWTFARDRPSRYGPGWLSVLRPASLGVDIREGQALALRPRVVICASACFVGRGHSRGTGPRATAPGGYLCFGLLRWAWTFARDRPSRYGPGWLSVLRPALLGVGIREGQALALRARVVMRVFHAKRAVKLIRSE